MAGRRKKKSANNSDNKASARRQRGGTKTKRPVGVTKRDPKRVPKSNVKRAQLVKGLSIKKGRQPQMTLQKYQDHAENVKDEASANTSSDNNASSPGSAVPLITPTLQRTLHLLDEGEEEFCVHDMVFVRTDIIVVTSVSGLVKAINIKGDIRVLSKLHLSGLTYVSKVDGNRVMLFCRPRQVAFATVIPELMITETIELENNYHLLRVLDKETLIGVTPKSLNNPSVDMLSMKGTKMKTIRPRLLRGLSLQSPEHLLVTRQKRIIVVDNKVNIVICFPSSGIGGFAYSGAGEYNRVHMEDLEREEFQKKHFYLFPLWVASDSNENIYVVDRYCGAIVKIDRDSNFIQNILLSPGKGERCHKINIDENDQLYASQWSDTTGTVKVFEL